MANAHSLSKIFQQREDYIIIGLTGRTGSGCSSLATILSSDNFADLAIRRENESKDVDARKHQIIIDFLKKKWNPFIKIEASSIIVLFMLDIGADLLTYFENKYNIKISEELKKEFEAILKAYKKITQLPLSHNAPIKNLSKSYDFYFEKLPKFRECLKKTLQPEKTYTQIFQDAGDSIRLSGKAFCFDGDGSYLLSISERINSLIKITREYNRQYNEKKPKEEKERKNYFVIDSFRNPFEAFYFKQRYSAFFMISVNAPVEQRHRRLLEKKFSPFHKSPNLMKESFLGGKKVATQQ